MGKKEKILLIVGIAIMVITLAGGGLFYYFSTKEKEPDKGLPTPPEPVEELNYSIPVYKCTYGGYAVKSDNYCKEEILVPTSVSDAKALIVESNFVLYEDNGLRIFNIDTKKYVKINLKNEYVNYALNISSDESYVAGIIYSQKDNKDSGYYNIKEDKHLYVKKYADLSGINENYIQARSEEDSEYNVDLIVLDANEEKEVNSRKDSVCSRYSSGKGYIIYEDGCLDYHVGAIYTKDFKLIIDDIDNYAISKDNEIYNLENDKVRVYNHNGKVVKTHILKDEILDIFEDYYLAHDNEFIYIRDYDHYEKKLGSWTKDMYYHSMLSGYYGENVLQNENEKEAGYYFIVQANDELGGTEYYFNPKTKETKSWELPEIGGYAKPVLYLYPEKETNVTVTFERPNSLTTTYPKFDSSWDVLAKPNGDLYDKDGKYYYGLYWEENSNHKVDFKTGFYVTKDNAIEFLEEKLSLIGFNDRERNEFIMYWLPILEKNNKSVVYFELTEERDNYNKIYITPKPDSLLRVAIHVKKVDEEVSIKEQVLPTFNRHGFTAVEWGGVLYN